MKSIAYHRQEFKNYFDIFNSIYVGGNNMDVRVGDTLVMKKQHPCGETQFDVLRVGMDFKIRCKKCGREVMLPRKKVEKNIKKIMRSEGENDV